MVYLNLHINFSDKTFEYYSLPKKILDKNYEIALIKLDGEINNSVLLHCNTNINIDIDENNNILADTKGMVTEF